MLQFDPSKRPACEKILNSDYFKEVKEQFEEKELIDKYRKSKH
jgi:hypothetical protein